MISSCSIVLFVVWLYVASVYPSDIKCDVRLRINSGWICGRQRLAEDNVKYASFRGIPYAQQPLGELRFKELQPVKPWDHDLDATEEGPICPQYDDAYGNLVKPVRLMSEACIYANVHVPLTALHESKGLPIFVFIHGGAFQLGSGDSDLQGPEYLVSKGVIVITFNYRLNVFGFLSLNSPKIPGNNGLRDQVTLLRWVQENAKAFGGDSSDVTLAGQSAGAVCAHMLSLSNVTKGLFKRVILMSGTAIPSFYTTSPIYAALAATRFLTLLGISSTDPDVIHDSLVNTPLEKILRANSLFQYEIGLVTFAPVVESIHPGVTRVLDDDPIDLIKRGRGKEYPLIIGFTDSECVFFTRRLLSIEILRRIEENPLLILPVRIPFSTLPNVALALAQKVIDHYFKGNLTLHEYYEVCREAYFEYSAFKLAQWRVETKAAPSFLYQFSYESEFSTIKAGLQLQYRGSAHVEDLTYIFRENAVLDGRSSFPPTNNDDLMKDWMTEFVINFIRHDEPSAGPGWLPVHVPHLNYQDINQPAVYINAAPTHRQREMIQLYDKLDQIASGNVSLVSSPGIPNVGDIDPLGSKSVSQGST